MAACIGLSPTAVDDLSLWQFQAMVTVYAEMNDPDRADALDDDDIAALSAALDAASTEPEM